MTKRRFASYADVRAAVGQDVAVTDWITITQDQVNQFAEATGDHQWIHVDPERAKAGPFGATIAHGYLTLSMLAGFLGGCAEDESKRCAGICGACSVHMVGLGVHDRLHRLLWSEGGRLPIAGAWNA